MRDDEESRRITGFFGLMLLKMTIRLIKLLFFEMRLLSIVYQNNGFLTSNLFYVNLEIAETGRRFLTRVGF